MPHFYPSLAGKDINSFLPSSPTSTRPACVLRCDSQSSNQPYLGCKYLPSYHLSILMPTPGAQALEAQAPTVASIRAIRANLTALRCCHSAAEALTGTA